MSNDVRALDAPLGFLSTAEYAHWRQMPGFLLESAAQRFFEAAAEVPAGGCVVELGTFAGKSMVCFASAVRNRAAAEIPKLVAIDMGFHDRWPETMDVFDLHGLVTPIEASSLDAAEAWTEPISLLYIDANHGLAHARADFVVWELFVAVGGVIALDDTAGFYPGCTHQVRMALSTGRYEHLDDVGGVTFLRKVAPLFEGVGISPLQPETAFAAIVGASAWSGAMDPQLRLPNPIRFRLPDELIEERLRATLAELDLVRARAIELRAAVEPTLTYIEAVVRLRLGEPEAALELLEPLTQSASSFYHYDLDIRPVALLRQAQVLDLAGRRDDAVQRYDEVLAEDTVEAVRAAATEGLTQAFELPEPVPGRLLREYILDSPLTAHARAEPPLS